MLILNLNLIKTRSFFKSFLVKRLKLQDLLYLSAINQRKYIIICPGGKGEFKRWSTANFARLCDLLAQDYKGDFLICGASDDSVLATEIINYSKQRFVNYTGKTSLTELIEIFAKAKVIITNDSGPLHIAHAMDKNLLCISRGKPYGRFLPYPKNEKSNDIYIYPKLVCDLLNEPDASIKLNDPDFAPDINTILPEDAYKLIIKTFFK